MLYTIVYKSGICPYWKVPVQMKGKYFYSQNPGEEFKARLSLVTCPIDENSILPFEKQRKEYRLMSCHTRDCELLKSYPERIDTRTNQPL